MVKAPQPSSEGGAPEYMVSYADMLTIMLAFFIVLYASTGANSSGNKGEKAGHGAAPSKEARGSQTGSGSKEGAGPKGAEALAGRDGKNQEPDAEGYSAREARMQEVFKSLHARFGPEWTIANCWIGGPPELRSAATSRVKRGMGVRNTGTSTWGQVGDDSFRARAPRPGENVLVGGRIYFDEHSAALSEPSLRKLRTAAEELAGKTQRIEIRGHTTRRPLPAGAPPKDPWDLAYARCRAVQDYLVSQGIDPRRIRLGVAADNEPLEGEGDLIPVKQNSRVEVHVLNEVVQSLSGPREDHPPTTPSPSPSPGPITRLLPGPGPGPSNSIQAPKSTPSAAAAPAASR